MKPSKLQKTAFIGKIVGLPFRAARKVAERGAGFVGNNLMQQASDNPLGFLGATAMGVPTLMSLQNPMKDPDMLAKGYQMRGTIAQAFPETAMKLSSSVLSQEDLQQAVKIRNSLEKRAAEVQYNLPFKYNSPRLPAIETKVPVPVPRGIPKAKGDVVGRLKDQVVDEVSDALRKAQLEKTIADTGLSKQRLLHEAEKHLKDMRQWSPRQLATAGLALGATAAAVGAGVHLLGQGAGVASEKIRSLRTPHRFKEVTKIEPSLKDNPLAPKYFALLERASPYIASEPYLAAATLQQMLNTPSINDGGVPAIQPKMLQEILKTEEARQGTRFPFLQRDVDLRNVPMLG
jgi:hypothetical protein